MVPEVESTGIDVASVPTPVLVPGLKKPLCWRLPVLKSPVVKLLGEAARVVVPVLPMPVLAMPALKKPVLAWPLLQIPVL